MNEAAGQGEFAGDWGEAPIDDCRMIIAMLMTAAEFHMWGFCDLLVADKTGPNTLDVLARAAIENLARATWLSEPVIGSVERIKRTETERLFSAAEEGKLGPKRQQAANDRKRHILATANNLGWQPLPSKKGSPPRLVRRPTATQLASQLLLDNDDRGLGGFLYRLLSASTHGTTYGLARFIHQFDDESNERADLGVLAVSSQEVDLIADALVMGFVSAMQPWLTYLGWAESETWTKSRANSLEMLNPKQTR